MARRLVKRRGSRSKRIRVFISHASEDATIARAVIDLLRAALDLPADAIRCTSVDGYLLPAGVPIDERLKREVHEADAFIGLISPASIRSIYVLFELGARWGAERRMLPLLAPGVAPNVLGGPIAHLSALQSDKSSQLHQLVTDVAGQLGVRGGTPDSYAEQLNRLAQLPPRKYSGAPADDIKRISEVSEHEAKQHIPSVKSITLKCSFDETGSGAQVRRWSGISTPQTLVNYVIPYKFMASSPQGIAIAHEGLVKEILRPRSVLAARFVKGTSNDPKTVEGNVVVIGHLTANTGFVGFEINQRFAHAFCMTRAEVDEAYVDDEWKTEYVGILVQIPTAKLVVTVEFPPSFRNLRPKPQPVFFWSSTEKVNDHETDRIESGFGFKGRTATLKVSHPRQGQQYAIYWTPAA